MRFLFLIPFLSLHVLHAHAELRNPSGLESARSSRARESMEINERTKKDIHERINPTREERMLRRSSDREEMLEQTRTILKTVDKSDLKPEIEEMYRKDDLDRVKQHNDQMKGIYGMWKEELKTLPAKYRYDWRINPNERDSVPEFRREF